MNNLDVVSLIESNDSEDMRMIDLSDLHDMSSQNIGQMLDLVEYETNILMLEGRHQCNRWWDAFRENIDKKNPENSYLGTRVRIIGGSLVFEWHKRKVRKGNAVSSSSSGYQAIYLKKGKGDRYSDRIFSSEPEWAQVLGKDIEDNYEILRERAKKLGMIKRAINSYSKSC